MKRKTEDIKGREDSNLPKEKKRKKHRHRSHEAEDKDKSSRSRDESRDNASSKEGSPKTENVKSEEETVRNRLEQLEQITQEIASSPKSIQDHIAHGGGVEIINAVAELARTFARSKSSSQQSSENKHEPPQLHKTAPPIKDKALETAVFTHQGMVHDSTPSATHTSYDRLEILGDAYLEIIATRLIWDRFQTLPAGRMSQIRETLVKNETLAEFSDRYGFDKRVRVAPDIRSQPKRWIKVKGDVFEAYVAAVILADPLNGFAVVEDWMTHLWTPKLNSVQPEDQAVHYKESLAKKVMGKGIKLRYINESPPVSLKDGMQTFFIGVYLTGWGWQDQHLGSGTGLNKVVAGNAAAKQALENHPFIDKIHAVKKAFDEKVQAEREKALSGS